MKPAREPLLLYLAPEGSDCWSGTLPAPNAEGTDGPFARPRRELSTPRQ